ncbi:hypothetical protein [Kingella potus]|uniref:hypothetical protein n=1 Tax=Kingella potus TaxID=265175 RepID=UPI001FD1B4DE|nr:hypothetical protein [Kingella potus]UOP00844.1 hypothetical protein LVJ84_14085 [Kingella potus]
MPTLNFLKDFCRQLSISEEHFVSYLEDVGFTLENGEIASYCPSKCYHFSFSQQYFLPQNAIHLSARKHPSWHLPAAAHHYQMGGVLQADEANPLIHLLTLDPIPEGVEISLEKVVFGLHIREANEGCGVLFYRHDEDGNPSRIGDKNVPEMQIDFPVLPCGIALAPTPERWQYQSWGSANSRENLFRLGGEPTWVQSAEVPVCPVSGEKMRFLFQMDSNLPDTEGGELLFGSGGVLYAFWCDKTRVSAYVLQCT